MAFNRRRSATAALFLAILLLIGPFIPGAFAEQIIYENPNLPSGTPAYDPGTPDKLIEDQLYARSAILIGADNGETIFEKDADRIMFPASTTKILTVLLALQIGNLNDTVIISENAVNLPPDATSAKLQAGEEVNLEELLYATMIVSGNDAATAVAEHISGSEEAFADLMNRAAEAYGCTNTRFTNANGLHDANHYTTARDMAIIAREAMDNPKFREISATMSYTMSKTNLQRRRTLNGRTEFLQDTQDNQYYFPAGTGIKTGYTNAAGNCFVGSASKDGVNLISVVLYSRDKGRYTDTAKLMNYGFSKYYNVSPKDLYDMNPITIDTTNFSLNDSNLGRLTLYAKEIDETAHASIIVNIDELPTLTRNFRQMMIIQYTRDFAAPVNYGDIFGTMIYVPSSGGSPIEYQLIAGRSIEVRENAPKSIEQIEMETYQDPNPFPPLSLELVLILLSPFIGISVVIYAILKLLKKRKQKLAKLPTPIRRRYK